MPRRLRNMLPHLAAAAHDARARTAVTTLDIAATAHVDVSTIRRFERAEAWPRDADILIAAYAAHIGCASWEIWKAALDAWMMFLQ